VAILGSTFDGSYAPVKEICEALDELQERTGLVFSSQRLTASSAEDAASAD
jgi:hypothetical protein